MKEYFGIDLSKKILERWVDPTYYIDNNSNIANFQTNRTIIAGIITNIFEKQIIECLNIVDGQNTASGIILLNQIRQNDVSNLIKRNYQAPSAKVFVYNLFSSGNSTNHYAAISNNSITIRNEFIDRIYELLKEKLNEYQNLNIGVIILQTIASCIQNTLNFWQKEYNVDTNPANWNKLLQQEISRMLSAEFLPTSLLQRKEYFEEQFTNIMLLCKMHVAVNELTNIQNTILTAKNTLRSQKATLPTIPKINNILQLVSNVINNNDSSQSLTRRMGDINSNLTTKTINFSTIFEHGSLKNDIKSLNTDYNNNVTNKFTYNDITNQYSLWRYLENIDHQKLFSDSVVRSMEYVNRNITKLQNVSIISLINNLKTTPGNNQWQAIKTFIEGNEPNIRTALPGMERIRPIDSFQSHSCLKLIYITGNQNALKNEMIPSGQGVPNYDITAHPDNCCELPGLNDAIIIFQEYGYMGNNVAPFDPTINIDINSTVKNNINNNFDGTSDAANQPNIFVFKRRVPYLTINQFTNYLNSK